MQSLLDSGKYSDLSLHCAEKTWKVHCAVVCTSSSVFAAMVDSDFKEAHNREIDLPDDEPEIVEKMLKFFYRGDYDDERDVEEVPSEKPDLVDPEDAENRSSSPDGFFRNRHAEPSEVAQIPSWSQKSLLVNAQMYIIGDKYDVGGLKKSSMGKYAELAERLWNTPTFPASVKLLYDNTPRSDRLLRDVIAKTAHKNISTLIRRQDFEDAMVSHGDLAVDVLKFVLRGETEPEFSYGTKKSKARGVRGYH